MNINKININQSELTYNIASNFDSVFDADGNTLTTVINNEALAITKLSDSTEKIKKESIDTEEDYISVETISGEEVFRLDDNGLNAKNIKNNGKEIALKEEVTTLKEDLEVVEYIEIKHEDTYTGEELILKSNNEEEEYVSIGDYGIKAKAYKLLDGSDAFDQ